MKKSIGLITIIVALFACAFTSCTSTKLEDGGAYAQPGQAPDIALYRADAGFDLAFTTVQAAFKFEKDNRIALWTISPEIKHALDKARPVAVQLGKDYVAARAEYLKTPTPEGLTKIQELLSKTQSISAAVTAALAEHNANK